MQSLHPALAASFLWTMSTIVGQEKAAQEQRKAVRRDKGDSCNNTMQQVSSMEPCIDCNQLTVILVDFGLHEEAGAYITRNPVLR